MNVLPGCVELLGHEGPETHAVLSLTLLVDGDTPVSLFRKLVHAAPGGAFLFESVEGGELTGRYSFVGFGLTDGIRFSAGRARIRRGAEEWELPAVDPLDLLREELARYRVLHRPDLPRFQGGAVGYLGYDCVACFEGVPLAGEPDPMAEAAFRITEELLVYDHVAQRLHLLVLMPLTGERESAWERARTRLVELAHLVTETRLPGEAPWAPDMGSAGDVLQPEVPVSEAGSAAGFMEAVARARERIAAGELFQVVLSRRWTAHTDVDPIDLYRALRALNPSPYMFFLHGEERAVVGASPEVLVRWEAGDLLVRPIAGTRRRGANPQEDAALERDLLADEKELAEHRMLLDLGRNDLGRVAELGSVRVEDPLHVERYSHVMHIVSDVRARAAEGVDCFDALRACFPAGTVSGAPKIRAMEWIAELEPVRRGLYAGAVGYFDFAGNMDTCIAIRTMVVEPGAVHLQAGAGIVFDSVPEAEAEECENKMKAGLVAVRMAAHRRRGAA